MIGSKYLVGNEDWENLGILGKFALVFAGAFITIGLFAMGPALPALQSSFMGEPRAGLIVQLSGGLVAPIFALFSPVAGRFVTQFGVRTVYLVSLAIFIIGGISPMVCSSLPGILPFRLILGIGVAGGFTAGMAGIALLPEQQKHTLYGLTGFVGGGICILAYPLVGLLAESGWRLSFLVHFLLLPAVMFAFGLPRGRAVRRSVEPGLPLEHRLGGVPPQLLLLAAIAGWATVSMTLYPPFLLATIGMTDPSRVGGVLAISSLFSLTASGFYGFFQRLLGTGLLLRAVPVLAAIGCIIVATASALPFAVVGFGTPSVGLAIFGAAAYAAAIEAIGATGDSGAATGIVSLAIYFPQIAFPLISSAIGARFGPAAVYMSLSGLLTLTLVLLIVKPVLPRPQEAIASDVL